MPEVWAKKSESEHDEVQIRGNEEISSSGERVAYRTSR